MLWFGDPRIAYVMSISMAINCVVAAIAGTSLPLLLKKLGTDPALAGSVLLVATTDVIGYFVFLGLASLFFIN